MKTDNYKLALFVPEKESQMPCDKCPITDICHAYNSYLVYNEKILEEIYSLVENKLIEANVNTIKKNKKFGR